MQRGRGQGPQDAVRANAFWLSTVRAEALMAPNRIRTNRADRSAGAYSHGRTSGTLPVRGERQVSGTALTRPSAELHDKRSMLAAAVTKALTSRRYDDALGHILKLIMVDPTEPRWHQKYGEVLRTLGRNAEAAAAYRRVARRYEALALPARASAALRVADLLDGGDSSERIAHFDSTDLETRAAQRLPTL